MQSNPKLVKRRKRRNQSKTDKSEKEILTEIGTETYAVPTLGRSRVSVPDILLDIIRCASIENLSALKWLSNFTERIRPLPPEVYGYLVIPTAKDQAEVDEMIRSFNADHQIEPGTLPDD